MRRSVGSSRPSASGRRHVGRTVRTVRSGGSSHTGRAGRVRGRTTTRVTRGGRSRTRGDSNPCCSILFGALLVAGAVALMAWNEMAAVRRSNALDAVRREVVGIKSDASPSRYAGQLVVLTGRTGEPPLQYDEDWGVGRAGAVALVRTVERYQWRETSKTREYENSNGDTVEEKTYYYDEKWSSTHISSSNFDDDSFSNPSGPWMVESRTFTVDQLAMGRWKLRGKALSAATKSSKPLYLTEAGLQSMRDMTSTRSSRVGRAAADMQLYDGKFWSGSTRQPEIGDYRVSFSTADAVRDMTLMGKAMEDGSVETYTTASGEEFFAVRAGTYTVQQMVDRESSDLATRTWLLRVCGFVLALGGFLAMLEPVNMLARAIPLVGSLLAWLTSLGTGIAAFLMAVCVSFITIAVAWLAARPLLSFLLLMMAMLPLLRGTATGTKLLDEARAAEAEYHAVDGEDGEAEVCVEEDEAEAKVEKVEKEIALDDDMNNNNNNNNNSDIDPAE